MSKRYQGRTVVDKVTVSVAPGQIFGLLGPNAAGKSTTIRMLCGVIKTDGGQVLLNGLPVEKAKNDFGYVAQHFGQYEELSVWENVKFYARMYGVKDLQYLNTLLDRHGLTPFKSAFAGTLSGGYQRRLALVCALAHDPKVLFLDEPTAGIDPVTRKSLWDEFYRLSAEGKTLFVTTHYMEEAQRCHQLAFISSGRIVAEGTPESIKHAMGDAKVFSARVAYQPALRDTLMGLQGIVLVNQFGDELRMVVKPDVSQTQLAEIIQKVTNTTVAVHPSEANLEDVFIALTQHQEEIA